MNIILFDNQLRKQLYPFSTTKAIASLRCGIFTTAERWKIKTGLSVYILTENYLQALYELPKLAEDCLFIDAAVFPDTNLFDRIVALSPNEALADDIGLIAGRINVQPSTFNLQQPLGLFETITDILYVKRLTYAWQLFQWNDTLLREDFKTITKGKSSQPISPTNFIHQQADIFIEEGATVEFAFLNSTTGPIYIGKNAEIWEGAVIRGPFAILDRAVIKANAKIYGATTIGPWCAVGGEIKNVIMSGYRNKAHDGYLGDSVIGEWCNLGAGTTNSNVKNTAAIVTMWNDYTRQYEAVANKAGLLMGDYSRVAINSSINTGSVIGVSANVFGEGLLPKLITDFSWGLYDNYLFDKAISDIANWKKFKQQNLTDAEVAVLKYIFEQNK
jgi:UDP-N-acetylglucosamine diphosphorylase/glucosamine-1-phosphate N-acetyltransferase